MTDSVTFVTSNEGKLREIRGILGIDVHGCDIDLPEYQFTDSADVAYYKAKEAAARVGGPVVVDDTALHFAALGGLPGAYIRAFVTRMSPLDLTRMIAAFDDKSATVTCSVAYCSGPGAEPVVFTGRVDGTIVSPRGSGGFGFDPIFQPNGCDRTYSELPEAEKNTLSHRYRALKMLRDSGLLGKK